MIGDKIRETMNAVVDYLYDKAMELDADSRTDVKSLVSALKTVIDIMNATEEPQDKHNTVMEGLREFFNDLNESDD